MEENYKSIKETERFSLISRLRSANHAWRGLGIVFKTTHNIWVHLFFTVAVAALGFILCISTIEWLFVVLAIGFVLVTETINTAIEIDIDLTSPEYHPYARDTKDVAAGAVLLAVLFAVIVGLIIFVPKLTVLI
ncbi:MAG: diacylglycerol kinase family protein [Candidatus Pacebacteria bacterium]|nr:diacylglycerol kinase family protein [Candidatus Paceibacterota bacterium]MBP9851489.1 diacylglycerol kinase family protein [Candidatus Paceibacterota bacterium]